MSNRNHTPKSCPNCGDKDGIKGIIYGYPTADFDFERFVAGGCDIAPDNPEWHCTHCSHEW